MKQLYLLIALGTWVYLLAFAGFNYGGGNWITHIPSSLLASLLWPIYWGWAVLA